MEKLNLEKIIEIKFDIEKEIEILTNNFKKRKSFSELSKNQNLTQKVIITQYTQNINMFGNEYLKQQLLLLNEINKILSDNCYHTWINESTDEKLKTGNICYCSKCFIYKLK